MSLWGARLKCLLHPTHFFNNFKPNAPETDKWCQRLEHAHTQKSNWKFNEVHFEKRLQSHLAEKCLPPMKGKRIQDVSSAPCGEACASSKCLHFRSVNKNMLLPHATIFSLCFYGASVKSAEIEPQDENQTSLEPIGQKMWSFIDTARVVFL